MSLSFIVFILLSMTSSISFAKKYHLILGGGGEPPGSTTIFDPTIERLGKLHQTKQGYQVEVSFNGGHSTTENIIRREFKGVENTKFTQKSYEELISKYEDLITSGKIKAGDNLLITIDTHGSVKTGKTHNISTTGETIKDYNKLGNKVVSLDRLKQLTLLAEKNGVNLGIIDLSCYSGNTLALANSKTCVITGAGTKHFGLTGYSSDFFSNAIASNLSTAADLESAFLNARQGRIDITFPMISTSEGNKTQNILYNALTPYLDYYTPKGPDNFTPFILKDFLEGDQCKSDQGFKLLKHEIEALYRISDEADYHEALLRLKKAVSKYHEHLEYIKKEMRKAGIGLLRKHQKFCHTIPDNNPEGLPKTTECIDHYNLKMLANLDIPYVIKFYVEKLQETNLTDKAKAKIKAQIECYKKMMIWRDKILAKNSHLLNEVFFWKETFPRISSETKEYARVVLDAEKEVYNLIYLNNKSKSKTSNPCREFKI